MPSGTSSIKFDFGAVRKGKGGDKRTHLRADSAPDKIASPALYSFIYFCFFGAKPAPYGSSQARGLIGATAAGLRHSNARSLTH